MPGPRKRFLGFIGRNSRHQRKSLDVPEPTGLVHPVNSNVTRNSSIEDELEPAVPSLRSEEEPFFNPQGSTLEATSSGYSGPSINAKPTSATLAETFSSGGHPESRDDGVQYYYSQEHHDLDQQYREFENSMNADADDETHSLAYTEGDNEDEYQYEQAQGDYVNEEENDAAFNFEQPEVHYDEEESLGYETCEKTLNTNLEGVNFLHPHSRQFALHQQRMRMANGLPSHMLHPTGGPQYHYPEEEYEEEYPEEYAREGYYDENGEFVAPYIGEQHHFDTHDEYDTVQGSTIATEQPKVANTQRRAKIRQNRAYPQDDASAPIESYESEESEDSWGEDETRDTSLLDAKDTQKEGETFDEDDSEDEYSDEESFRRRRRRPKSMMHLLGQMKHCSPKGSSVSFGDDESEDDFQYVPDVAQISSGASSMTSMTDSYQSRTSSSYRRKQTKGGKRSKPKRRGRRHEHNLDRLFEKVSAIGHELLGSDEPEEPRRRRKGRTSRRRRDMDPAVQIVDSLRELFSCGNPRYY